MKPPVEPISCSCCGASPEILIVNRQFTCICPECGNADGDTHHTAENAVTSWNHKNEQQYLNDLDNTNDDWNGE